MRNRKQSNSLYRVMVRGEDGVEFCYASRVPESEVDEKLNSATMLYCGRVWLEMEGSVYQDMLDRSDWADWFDMY